MSREAFEHFHARVLADPALQRALRDTPDLATFLVLAQRLSAEQGCPLTESDLRDAMDTARRTWRERWI
ncbi:Nif11 family protein [Myxococcaceae bacterium JPH2]|nr:Nif11 family protein [Myxococcaceae bacterium JPH2]